ncbi:MAG: hypothetical protein K0U45_07695 [Alphaproteobacteria bacterium]|nr:hypothetical protein [Alphaproteobacteria bacterium]
MKNFFASDYYRALRLSLILHVVIIVFIAFDIFNLFKPRSIEVSPDIALVTEAELAQISQQIKKNQEQITQKPIAEPEPEKATSKIASAIELIDKNIKALSKTESTPEPAPEPTATAKPPAKTEEQPKILASPDNKKAKIDKIDLSNLVIDSSQQNETGNKELQEIEKNTQKIAQNIAQNKIKPIEPKPEPKPKITPESEIESEPEVEIESEPEVEIEPEIAEEIPQTPEPETVQEVIEQEVIEQEITPQDVVVAEVIVETQTVSDLESDLGYQELVILREQIGTCWNPPLGAKNIDDLIIRVQIELDEQGILKTARILHSFGADINDPFYRAATESALRAVYHPNCTPLKLPKDKYDIWKKTILTFNPTEILP